jgi:predicted transcriptional regulator
MNVADIMSKTPVTVYRDTPVEEVARIISEQHISGVPVIEREWKSAASNDFPNGANGQVIGVITEEDLIMRSANPRLPTFLTILDSVVPIWGRHDFEEEMRHILATHAGEMMSEHLYTVAPSADVSEAAAIMVEKHANPLPVVEHGRLVGVISRSDIVRLMVREDGGGQDEAAGT